MSLYLRNFSIYFIIILSVFVATGCAEDDSTVIEAVVQGAWTFTEYAGYEEKWVITETNIQYLGGLRDDGSWSLTNYEADVVFYTNGIFNGGESDASDHGYAVIQLTYSDGPGTGVVGQYNIFRWKELTSTSCDFSQGGKWVGVYPNNTNQLFDNQNDAESQITATNGYFGGYSSGAVRQ